MYSEFNSTGRIPQDYDSLVTEYGSDFVLGQGILPWAIITTYDSLKVQFERRDWDAAKQSAADLGHYVGNCPVNMVFTLDMNHL